ncbi:MAG: hypothetical protein DWI24_11810 [Planctomycetota bacterium]|nr:MAG: hypothetical protein DWI24_11810 [Planctomycetota bacterium]
MQLDSLIIDELIREAKTGSVMAVDQLFTLSMPKLENWSNAQARLFHKLRLSCRDLTQEVVLIAKLHFNQFRGDTTMSWLAWLKRIHFRMMQAMLKEQKRSAIISYDVLLDYGVDVVDKSPWISKETTPGSLASLKEQTERVKCVMNQMDQALQQALTLWFDGVTLEQHAEMLSTKVHNIRYLRFKALKEFNTRWKTLILKD